MCNIILPISFLPKMRPKPNCWLRPAGIGLALVPRPGYLPLPLPGSPQAAAALPEALAALWATSCFPQQQPLLMAEENDRALGGELVALRAEAPDARCLSG